MHPFLFDFTHDPDESATLDATYPQGGAGEVERQMLVKT